MPQHPLSLVEILTIYREGYYPLWYEDEGLIWVREDVRPHIPITMETLERARRMKKRIREAERFEIRWNHDPEAVIEALRDPALRGPTWVSDEVVEIYRTLREAEMLVTVEAWREGKLAGGLLGIDWPRAILAETMFTHEDDASKLCLIELVEWCAERGYALIDVQQEHPPDHPSARLGERVVPYEEFMRTMDEVLR
jgi:leucyl/phenylalanyl-tRNA--protein transferase